MSTDKKILSIDYDDDNNDYEIFNQYLTSDTERKKNKTVSEIEEIGDQLLQEIDRKNKNKEIEKEKLIPYILKHSKSRYNIDELISYSFEDVKKIYDEIKEKSFLTKLFHFLFNIEN